MKGVTEKEQGWPPGNWAGPLTGGPASAPTAPRIPPPGLCKGGPAGVRQAWGAGGIGLQAGPVWTPHSELSERSGLDDTLESYQLSEARKVARGKGRDSGVRGQLRVPQC